MIRRVKIREAKTHLSALPAARPRRLRIQSADETDDREVMALARAHRLTAYDASYLALAIRDGCALTSLDQRLNEAAAAEGVAPFA